MKKLIFAIVLLFGTMFASCNGHSEANTEAVDSVEVVTDSVDTVSVDTLVVDSIAVDSIQ